MSSTSYYLWHISSFSRTILEHRVRDRIERSQQDTHEMNDFDQLASAGLTIVLSAIMLVTSLLFIDARSTKRPLPAPKAPTASLSTSPRS
jgi:hypothetical protein